MHLFHGNRLYILWFRLRCPGKCNLRRYAQTTGTCNGLSDFKVKWYYASDIPNRKPSWEKYTKLKDPQKFIPFSEYDSSRLEKEWGIYKKDPTYNKGIVEVNEDRLFQVDLGRMELEAVYWEGPVYEVRRGTWFYSNGMPLPRSLSEKVENGYQAVKPQKTRDSSESLHQSDNTDLFQKTSMQRSDTLTWCEADNTNGIFELDNSTSALYRNDKQAILFPSLIGSQKNQSIIRNIASSPVSWMFERIQRGYTSDLNKGLLESLSHASIPSLGDLFENEIINSIFPRTPRKKLDDNVDNDKSDKNKRSSKEKTTSILEADFDHDVTPISAKRDIEHLVFCIHGIGQILGQRHQSINFIHSINVLRKNMKYVYQSDKEYQTLAHSENFSLDNENVTYNNKIQVLPISWRHKIDFQPNRRLEDYNNDGSPRLPSFDDLNAEGVKSLRNILGDVVLDVLLYYEPVYFEQIKKVVTEELNRVYTLYKERNPNFNGKIHILGHSLGSVIAFDILSSHGNKIPDRPNPSTDLLFDVNHFYCLGSPIGIFKLLNRKNIKPRSMLPKDFNCNAIYPYVSPKCSNIYNIFHPCDPVSCRIEPLIHPSFSNLKPQLIPFALKGLNSQIKDLANFSNEIQEIILKASNWFRGRGPKSGDAIHHSIESLPGDNMVFESQPVPQLPNKLDEEKKTKKVYASKEDLFLLASANKSGRVDYCLPMGIFDVSLVSALISHVSYFEDIDTAGFLIKQLLSSEEKVKEKEVHVYE